MLFNSGLQYVEAFSLPYYSCFGLLKHLNNDDTGGRYSSLADRKHVVSFYFFYTRVADRVTGSNDGDDDDDNNRIGMKVFIILTLMSIHSNFNRNIL